MPGRLLTSTNDCGLLLRLTRFLGPNAALMVMAWVPALFECEDDEASGGSLLPLSAADTANIYGMTQ